MEKAIERDLQSFEEWGMGADNVIAKIERAIREGTTELSLEFEGLETLPPEIGNLFQVQRLYLFGNLLEALPPEIGQLQNLQLLDLGGNQLRALPAEIGQLQNLQLLDLRGNQLRALPAEIGQLQNLQQLYLCGNPFEELSPAIAQLQNLQLLDLEETASEAELLNCTSAESSTQPTALVAV